LYFQSYPEVKPASALANTGKQIWQSKNCASCHQLYGLGGHLGPDLTNVYSKRQAAYISSFLKTGTQVMPNFHLSDAEIEALLAFFEYTDKSGVSDPKSFELNVDGTISHKHQNLEQ
jgi:nitric oxide reductase subunit C